MKIGKSVQGYRVFKKTTPEFQYFFDPKKQPLKWENLGQGPRAGEL